MVLLKQAARLFKLEHVRKGLERTARICGNSRHCSTLTHAEMRHQGGTATINAIPAVDKLVGELEGDERTGAKIVRKALEAPLRQIAANAGLEGSVVIDNILKANKPNYGFDAQKEEYVEDMIEAGIVDPTKVTRSALENAASVAAMVLTTESLVADLPEPPAPAAPAGGDMGGMY